MKRSAAAVLLVSVCVFACEKKEPPVVVSPEAVEPAPPAAVPLTEQEEFKIAEEEPAENVPSPTPGQRLDHAIEKTEQGLGTAKEKTGEGLRKAAEKTGEFLKRTGETIERKAGE